MTTRLKKHQVAWLILRYPEHAKMLQESFTLAEIVEKFLDSASALHIISKHFTPDDEDVEQIDKALLLRLWWLGDVGEHALEIILSWLGDFRSKSFH